MVFSTDQIPDELNECIDIQESETGKKLASWSFNQSNFQSFRDDTMNGFNVSANSSPDCVWGINSVAVNLFDKSHLLTVQNSEKAFAVPRFTIEGWINYDKDPCMTDDMGGQAKIFDFNKITTGIREGYSFFLMPGGVLAMSMADKYGSYWNVCTSAETLLPGHWYHVAGTYDGEKMRVYINGKLTGEVYHTGGYPLPHGNAHIGCQIRTDGSVNSCFFGKIDELSFYDYPLCQEAVFDIFNSSKPDGYDSSKWFQNERGLVAEYFDDIEMTNCIIKKIVPQIDFNWGGKPPVSEITDNNYAVRWSGFIQPVYSGKYKFYLNADSPAKVWINNELIIDGAIKSDIILTAGQSYTIKIEYQHKDGDAYVSLKWSNYDVPLDLVPQERLLLTNLDNHGGKDAGLNGTGNGLKGEYFNNTDLAGSFISRLDPEICFDWENGSPDPHIYSDNFSVRWTGKIEPRFTGKYAFHTITDDGVRLWIDNKLIIDEWKGIPMQEHSGTIQLEASKKYNITMEYYERGIRAGAILEWSSSQQKREVVPKSQLYCDEPVATATIPPATPTPIVNFDISSADFDGDGIITVSDFIMVAKSFNTIRGDGIYKEKYDLNSDGAINMADIMIMIQYFR